MTPWDAERAYTEAIRERLAAAPGSRPSDHAVPALAAVESAGHDAGVVRGIKDALTEETSPS